MAWVKKNNQYGFVDKTGKEIVPLQYDRAWNFREGLALANQDREFFDIDKTGKRIN